VGLIGIDWVLDDASLATLVAGVPAGIHIDLRFGTEQASGTAGCASYTLSFQAVGGSISFGPIRSNQLPCRQQLKEASDAYLRALEGSTDYQATSSTLLLTGGAADLAFTASTAASPAQ
jgi:heat shock protein HslJ